MEAEGRHPTSSTSASPGCILLAGPTAAGTSEVALLLAERHGGEIISVDSMQVYRGLDIGTAKPTLEERQRVPHHLIDVAEVTEPFDAARFEQLAHEAVRQIHRRGKTAILCGGTGLYFMAFLQGLGEGPPADETVRTELESLPLPALLQELAERDPKLHQQIDQRNRRRVLRAVEVCRLTGKPFSEQRADWDRGTRKREDVALYVIDRPADELHERIGLRVDRMFDRGLVNETRDLLGRGLAKNRTAMQALGYRQVAEYLEGARALEQTIELVKVRTRQFAKRQKTWFRRHGKWLWVEGEKGESSESLAERLMQKSTFFQRRTC